MLDELMEEISKRLSLIEHIAQWAGTTPDIAQDWLDAQDLAAIETAERILASEPYTDIPVPHTYH